MLIQRLPTGRAPAGVPPADRLTGASRRALPTFATGAGSPDEVAIMPRFARSACVLSVLLVVAAAPAGVFQQLFRDLDYAATPLGSPLITTSDGTRVNGARSGRVRIAPNGLYNGYRLEYDRTYGADSTGRPETLWFGPFAQLTLQGPTQATLAYNHAKWFYTGTSEVLLNNVGYDLRSKLGLQDAELSGTFSLNQNLEVNSLGFYSLTLTASNANSEFKLDGVIVNDTQDINFNVGPIVVSGNVYYDAAVALATALGGDTTQLEDVFPQSPIDQIDDAIRTQLQQSSAQFNDLLTPKADLSAQLMAALLGGDQEAAGQLLSELAATAGQGTGDAELGATDVVIGSTVVPEPGTLLLAALGSLTVWYSRRR
jgi:hypothetical protein